VGDCFLSAALATWSLVNFTCTEEEFVIATWSVRCTKLNNYEYERSLRARLQTATKITSQSDTPLIIHFIQTLENPSTNNGLSRQKCLQVA
jgi:hypothetical protein